MLKASVVAVVVTWNAEDLIAECLGSVPEGTSVVVVDNASADKTVSLVRSRFPHARVVVNGSNAGFAAAANRGLREVGSAEFALLLNPDARLESGALDQLVAFAVERSRAGLVSALVVDGHGRPERHVGGHDVSLFSVGVHELGLSGLLKRWSLYGPPDEARPRQVGWVGATCLLVRRTALDEVGPLDEAYFLYCEDTDWCARMWKAGWEVWREPRARAVHRGSELVGRAGPWVDEHRVGALDRFFAARHNRASVGMFRLLRVIGSAGRALVFGVAAAATRRPELAARARQRVRDLRIASRLLTRGR